MNRAFVIIEGGCSDLYKLSEPLSPQEQGDIHDRLNAVVGFINDAIDAMEKAGTQRTALRRHDEPHKWRDLTLLRQLDHVHGRAACIGNRTFPPESAAEQTAKRRRLTLVLCHYPAVGTPLPGHYLLTSKICFGSNHANCQAPGVNDPRRVRSSPD